MFKAFLAIHVLFLFSINLKSQHVDSNLVFFDTYDAFTEGRSMDLKCLAYITKENDEWIEIEKLVHAKTLKKIRKTDKVWAFKYGNSYYLNSYFTNASFSRKWFFYKIDSITLNSIFIIIDINTFNRDGFNDVSYTGSILVEILDRISGLNQFHYYDAMNQEKLIFFISKKRIRSKPFSIFSNYNFWNDKHLVTARFLNYGELVSLSNQHEVTINKIINKELDELTEVLPFLDNLP